MYSIIHNEILYVVISLAAEDGRPHGRLRSAGASARVHLGLFPAQGNALEIGAGAG